MSAISDADGRFTATGLGCIDDACELEFVLPGASPKVLPLRTYCTDAAFACRRACSRLDVNVVAE